MTRLGLDGTLQCGEDHCAGHVHRGLLQENKYDYIKS